MLDDVPLFFNHINLPSNHKTGIQSVNSSQLNKSSIKTKPWAAHKSGRQSVRDPVVGSRPLTSHPYMFVHHATHNAQIDVHPSIHPSRLFLAFEYRKCATCAHVKSRCRVSDFMIHDFIIWSFVGFVGIVSACVTAAATT